MFPAINHAMRAPESKILTRAAIREESARLRRAGKRVVFTNGCFDLLHAGHVDYLGYARALGDVLVVGLNADASVRAQKGPGRPFAPEADRARVLAALECVDYVVTFPEAEPEALVAEILPDVLVKGEDWAHYVSGGRVVEANGGRVVLAPLTAGRSTSELVRRIAASASGTRTDA